MKKLIPILLTAIMLYTSPILLIFPNNTQVNVYAQKEVPPYAKWGRLAMAETKKKYPNADIIDYLHVGRKSNGKTSTEKFKLWLKENNKEFGVYVMIEFDNKTEDVIKINYEKTNR